MSIEQCVCSRISNYNLLSIKLLNPFNDILSSSIRCAWERVHSKFRRLFKRSAFVHHFESEGIEICDLMEASENMMALIRDYEEVERDSAI